MKTVKSIRWVSMNYQGIDPLRKRHSPKWIKGNQEKNNKQILSKKKKSQLKVYKII